MVVMSLLIIFQNPTYHLKEEKAIIDKLVIDNKYECYPTILDMAEIGQISNQHLDRISFKKVFSRGNLPIRSFFGIIHIMAIKEVNQAS